MNMLRFLTLIALTLFINVDSLACTCSGDGLTDEQALSYYKHILVVRITEAHLGKPKSEDIKLNMMPTIKPTDEIIVKTSFTIEETLKGKSEKIEYINGYVKGSHSCSLPILVGNYYLIFSNDNQITLTLCGRSKVLDGKEDEDVIRLKQIINSKKGDKKTTKYPVLPFKPISD